MDEDDLGHATSSDHASEAFALARLVSHKLGDVRLGPHGFSPELVVLDDDAEEDAEDEALQHLCLRSEDPSVPDIVVGAVDAPTRSAEIRTFRHVDARHRRRFARPVDLDRAQFDDFATRTREIFLSLGYETVIADTPRAFAPSTSRRPPPPEAPRTSRVVIGVVLAVLAAALVTAAWWMR